MAGGGKYPVCLVVVLYAPEWREHCGLIGGGRYRYMPCVSGCCMYFYSHQHSSFTIFVVYLLRCQVKLIK